jgi:hypothetical protein
LSRIGSTVVPQRRHLSYASSCILLLTYYKAAAKNDNAAATERKIGKFKKYEEAIALNPIPANFIFQPLVVDTNGSWSDAATQLLVRIGK